MESISLPTVNTQDYQVQSDYNAKLAEDTLKAIFPGITAPAQQIFNLLSLLEASEIDPLKVPYDTIFKTMAYLQETKVNPELIPQVIRGVHNVVIGTGRGQVILHVDRTTTNVQVREQGWNMDTSKEL